MPLAAVAQNDQLARDLWQFAERVAGFELV